MQKTQDSTIQNRVVIFDKIGDASVLEIRQEHLVAPETGEIRIKVDKIGLNRAEVMFRNGTYLEQPQFPSKLGYEASGIVDAVGADVTEFKIGDRVSTIPAFSMAANGVYSEWAYVPAHAVAHFPENLTMAEGTAIWMQYITAYGALVDIGKLSADDTVLITAASSSVGIATIQLAKQIGAKVIATTRGPEKVAALIEVGADHVIQTDTEDLAETVASITDGKGVKLIFDPIAGPILEDLAAAAAPGATIVEYGALDDRATPYPLIHALAKGLTIRGYTLFEITQDAVRLGKAKEFLYEKLASGTLVPLLDKNFAFDDIQAAHRYMEANQQIGKIIVSVG